MERFTDKNMTDSQITEIIELMDGEHAKALELWGARNYNQGTGNGMILGAVSTLLVAGCAKIAYEWVKLTWNMGKAVVEVYKDKQP